MRLSIYILMFCLLIPSVFAFGDIAGAVRFALTVYATMIALFILLVIIFKRFNNRLNQVVIINRYGLTTPIYVLVTLATFYSYNLALSYRTTPEFLITNSSLILLLIIILIVVLRKKKDD